MELLELWNPKLWGFSPLTICGYKTLVIGVFWTNLANYGAHGGAATDAGCRRRKPRRISRSQGSAGRTLSGRLWGNCQRSLGMVILSMEKADLAMESGDFTGDQCDLSMENADLAMEDDDSNIKHGG